MEIVVIGGGPAGLAAAGALRRRGMVATILERGGSVGTSWRHHYDRLHLHTVRALSGLPGMPIPARMGKWVARADLVDYLEAYARELGLEVRCGTTVKRVDRDGAGWIVRTGGDVHVADRVVVATGYNCKPKLPRWPGRASFLGELVHSSEYRNPAPYRGKKVLVVGSGNSGAEIAVDLVEGGAAAVKVAVRTPPNIQRREFLGIPTQVLGIAFTRLPASVVDPLSLVLQKLAVGDLRPYGLEPPPRGVFSRINQDAQIPIIDVGFLDALRERRLEVVGAVQGFAGAEVLLAGDGRLRVDAVIAATGFERGLEPLVGHLGVLREDGLPAVNGGASSPAAPGLHFVGYENSPGGLLRKIRLDAEAVAARIAA